MTVSELIAKLNEFDGDINVMIVDEGGSAFEVSYAGRADEYSENGDYITRFILEP